MFRATSIYTLFPLQQHRFFKGVAPSVKMSPERPVISP
ncbi:rCG59283 [Rattus norvegicus]|uniref:RCG59283 n=1 Tax=Rattus norvegicus TaxID=10116 RepID=A6K7Q0_RAT|nr:rCG59283 [Rattus norvegicus]